MDGTKIDLSRDFRDLLRAFCDHDVRFLIVGAYALAVLGQPRATQTAVGGLDETTFWLYDLGRVFAGCDPGAQGRGVDACPGQGLASPLPSPDETGPGDGPASTQRHPEGNAPVDRASVGRQADLSGER